MGEVPVIQTVEKIVDVPVVKQLDVPQVTTIEKIVEVPHMQTIEKVVEVPVAGQTLQGAERHVNVPLPMVRQMGPAENVTETVMGAPLPAEHAGQIIKAPPVQAPPVMTAEPIMVAAPPAPVMTAEPILVAAPPVMAAAPPT